MEDSVLEQANRFEKPVRDKTPRDITDEEADELVHFLKVLADKTRLRILGLLSEREHTVKELAAALELKEPTVSSHLAMLKWRGMVTARPEGTSRHYRLSQDSVHALLQDLTRKASHEIVEDPESGEFEKHVLRTFFEGDRLIKLPAKQSRQLVILRHLVKQFRYGEFYTEKQVNEILGRANPDYATLRRLLIDWKMMARENGRYWRLEEQRAA